MLSPFANASRYIAIHQVSLLLHAATVARRLRIDVHDNDDDDDDDNNDNDNAWQRGPLWPHRMGPKKSILLFTIWHVAVMRGIVNRAPGFRKQSCYDQLSDTWRRAQSQFNSIFTRHCNERKQVWAALPQREPRDALHQPIALYAKVDGQCDKLVTVVGRLLKLKFHENSFLARIIARMSACRATSPFSLQRAYLIGRSAVRCGA